MKTRKVASGRRLPPLSNSTSQAGLNGPDFYRMSRRAVLSLAGRLPASPGGAAVPWTLSTGGLAAAVTRTSEAHYGIELRSRGGAPSRSCRRPRIKFEQITFASKPSSLRAEGGTLRADIDLLPLLLGRVALRRVSLNDSRSSALREAFLRSRTGRALSRDAPERADRTPRDRRFVLPGMDRPEDSLDNINAVFAWWGPTIP